MFKGKIYVIKRGKKYIPGEYYNLKSNAEEALAVLPKVYGQAHTYSIARIDFVETEVTYRSSNTKRLL